MIDVAVFTILEEEEEAAIWFLELEGVKVHWLPNDQSFKCGIFNNSVGQQIHIAVFGSRDQGNISMATLTALVHAALLPRLSVLVGIAAGLKSGDLNDGNDVSTVIKVDGVKIGTVLVPREVVDYSFAAIKSVEDLAVEEQRHRLYRIEKLGLAVGKLLDEEEHEELIVRRNKYMGEINSKWTGKLDGVSFPPPPKIANNTWVESLKLNVVPPTEFKVTNGDVASSNLLLKNAGILQKLHARHHPQVKGAEMEAAGFAAASRSCNAEWFVIRAVSDFGDEDKSDRFQPYACANAAGYLAVLLRKLDLNLLRNGRADALQKHRLQKAEYEIKVVLEAFASIFDDQLKRKVNLEIYWTGQAKLVGKVDRPSIQGVIRDGKIKAERGGFLNRYEPRRFFSFKPKRNEPRAVAQAADPENMSPEVFHSVSQEENTPLKWVYAIPLYRNMEHAGDRTGTLCCTSTEPILKEATTATFEEEQLKLKAMLGIVRDLVTSTCISTCAFDLVTREVTIDVEP